MGFDIWAAKPSIEHERGEWHSGNGGKRKPRRLGFPCMRRLWCARWRVQPEDAAGDFVAERIVLGGVETALGHLGIEVGKLRGIGGKLGGDCRGLRLSRREHGAQHEGQRRRCQSRKHQPEQHRPPRFLSAR